MSHNKVDKSLGVNEKHAGIHGWMVKFVALVEVNRRNGESDFAVCTRLAPKLSAAPSVRVAWSPNYVHQILRGKLGASNRFWGAVKTLVEKKPYWVKETASLRSIRIQRRMEFGRRYLPPWKRRRILLRAIGKCPKTRA